MIVKIKKINPNAVMPKFNEFGALELTNVGIYQPQKNEDGSGIVTYTTGWSIEVPEGYIGVIVPNRSICETSMVMANSLDIIYPNDNNEVLVRFRINTTFPQIYQPNEVVAQMIFVPYIQPLLGEVIEKVKSEIVEENGTNPTTVDSGDSETTLLSKSDSSEN